MKKTSFVLGGKRATLRAAEAPDRPLVVLNTWTGDGASVAAALEKSGAPEANLLTVGDLAWDHDMTPWPCPPLSPGDTPCTGGAEDYLALLLSEILPAARAAVRGTPPFQAIAGYSLAGLFALWAIHRCDAFARAASMSGSLWFPGFAGFCRENAMPRRPDRLYLSLGDREDRTRNPVLSTVRTNTEALAAHWRAQGLDVRWELNPGNHFKEPALRSAKGILAIL